MRVPLRGVVKSGGVIETPAHVRSRTGRDLATRVTVCLVDPLPALELACR